MANKIKRVQACIDARGHHFQTLLLVHSDLPNFPSSASPCAITFQLDSTVALVRSDFPNALYFQSTIQLNLHSSKGNSEQVLHKAIKVMEFCLKYCVPNKKEGKKMNNPSAKQRIKTNYLYFYNIILNYQHK